MMQAPKVALKAENEAIVSVKGTRNSGMGARIAHSMFTLSTGNHQQRN